MFVEGQGPSTHIRSRFPLHPSSPRCSLWMEHPSRGKVKTNFGAAAEDYAKFRAGFPDSFFDRLAAFGIGPPGEVVVDVGTGTGTLARGFAMRGCKVIGVDPDDRLLNQARQLDAMASVTIDYKLGYAEAIPLADESADVVAAGQCWHWFDGPKSA